MSGSRMRLALACSCAAVALSVCGPTARSASAAGDTGTTVTRSTNAGPYSLTLQIGPMEPMYTPDQVKKEHPKRGEVMLRGSMAMGDMAGPMPNHHLEVHIYRRATRATVTAAMVAITIATPAGKVLQRVPIAVMRGVTAGATDTHFGNNVALKDGAYTIVVQVEQTKTTFAVTIGHAAMSM